jgi:hypothetical protein
MVSPGLDRIHQVDSHSYAVDVHPKVFESSLGIYVVELLGVGDRLENIRQLTRRLNGIHGRRFKRPGRGVLEPKGSEEWDDVMIAQARPRIVEIRNPNDDPPHRQTSC